MLVFSITQVTHEICYVMLCYVIYLCDMLCVFQGYGKEYYCPVCSDPDDGSFMIGCDGCDEWFHG